MISGNNMPHDYKADRERLERVLDARNEQRGIRAPNVCHNAAIVTDLKTMAGAIHAAAHPEKSPPVIDFSKGAPDRAIEALVTALSLPYEQQAAALERLQNELAAKAAGIL